MRTSIRLVIVFSLVCICFGSVSAVRAEQNDVTTGTAYRYKPESTLAEGGGAIFRIELRDAELKDSLRFLAKIANTNVIIPENVTGLVNVSFEDITLLDAITAITRANGLDYALERGVLRVGKSETFKGTGDDLKTETFRLKYASAKDLPAKVQKLLSDRGSVLSDERTNSLIVRERLTNIENVRKFIENIDVRDSQVLIEAKIVEVTREFSRSLGIQWGVSRAGTFSITGLRSVGENDSKDGLLNVNLPALNPTSGIGMIVGTLGGGTNLDVQLTAAEARGDAHVISEPSIVTSNGIDASIRSGETMYVKTVGDVNIGAPGGTQTTSGQSGSGLQQIVTGVELKVTPQISVDNFIKLNIGATTSQPDFSRAVDGVPVVVDNTAKTTVMIGDGETTVIGGLMKFRGSNRKSKVPLLGDVPLLGNLFKSKTRAKTNTELMVFIKPTIIRFSGQIATEPALSRADALKRELTLPAMKKKKRWNESEVDLPKDVITNRKEDTPYIQLPPSLDEKQ